MRVVRALGGALLWVLASVMGLVAILLCLTVILLPLGLPLLALARRLFATSIRLILPRSVAHPLKASADAAKSSTRKAADDVIDRVGSWRSEGHQTRERLGKRWKKLAHA